MNRIGAILVVYNFEFSALQQALENLCAQTDCVCVVDNSSTDSNSDFVGLEKVVYLPLMHNSGIAAAQNAGLRYLLEQNYDYVLFSDQDSLVPDGGVRELLDTYLELKQQGYPVCAVGPRAYNKQTGQPYPHQCNQLGELQLPSGRRLTELTYVMSSLSLQAADTFRRVGLMDETLFIDGVDCEWCWRGAWQQKLRYFVNEDIHVEHQLGLGTRSVAGKQRSITPPYRMRYMYRNYLWLMRRSYTPRRWLWYNGWKYLAKIVYYGLFSNQRRAYISQICHGISEGLKKN